VAEPDLTLLFETEALPVDVSEGLCVSAAVFDSQADELAEEELEALPEGRTDADTLEEAEAELVPDLEGDVEFEPVGVVEGEADTEIVENTEKEGDALEEAMAEDVAESEATTENEGVHVLVSEAAADMLAEGVRLAKREPDAEKEAVGEVEIEGNWEKELQVEGDNEEDALRVSAVLVEGVSDTVELSVLVAQGADELLAAAETVAEVLVDPDTLSELERVTVPLAHCVVVELAVESWLKEALLDSEEEMLIEDVGQTDAVRTLEGEVRTVCEAARELEARREFDVECVADVQVDGEGVCKRLALFIASVAVGAMDDDVVALAGTVLLEQPLAVAETDRVMDKLVVGLTIVETLEVGVTEGEDEDVKVIAFDLVTVSELLDERVESCEGVEEEEVQALIVHVGEVDADDVELSEAVAQPVADTDGVTSALVEVEKDQCELALVSTV
jgi:hypothetical protein